MPNNVDFATCRFFNCILTEFVTNNFGKRIAWDYH